MSSTAFASMPKTAHFRVLEEHVNEDTKSAIQIAQWNQDTLYTFVSEEISYCSQTISDNKIQFSYVLTSDGIVVTSDIYDIDEILNQTSIYSNKNTTDTNINTIILNNIYSFTKVRQIPIVPADNVRGFSTLSAAITDAFGSNYSSLFKGSSNKTYNNTTYGVRCTESQTTSYTSPTSKWFAKDTAMTAVVAWALSGSWSWIGAVSSIVVGVVSTIIVNGVNSVANAFTAERSNVSLMHTRMVTVNGYTGTQYWAGWTRKMCFFKGELGWTHDTGYNHNIKHSDFDNVSGLMETGFQNFINYTL